MERGCDGDPHIEIWLSMAFIHSLCARYSVEMKQSIKY